MLPVVFVALCFAFFRKFTIWVLLYVSIAFFIVLKRKQVESQHKKTGLSTVTRRNNHTIKNNAFLQHYHPALYYQT